MKTTPSDLPNDPQHLQTIILQMQALLDKKDGVIASLRHQLAVLKRARFGRSSEQLDKQIDQLEMQLEELEIQAAEIPRLDMDMVFRVKKKRNLNAALPYLTTCLVKKSS